MMKYVKGRRRRGHDHIRGEVGGEAKPWKQTQHHQYVI
jgi:hypothetical protein